MIDTVRLIAFTLCLDDISSGTCWDLSMIKEVFFPSTRSHGIYHVAVLVHHRDKSLQIGLGKRIFHVTIDFYFMLFLFLFLVVLLLQLIAVSIIWQYSLKNKIINLIDFIFYYFSYYSSHSFIYRIAPIRQPIY